MRWLRDPDAIVVLAILVFVWIVIGVAAAYGVSSSDIPARTGTPLLDAERVVGQQNGETPGVVTCQVSQRATGPTALSGIYGTISHQYLGKPKARQRAQYLVRVWVHKQPLTDYTFSGHPGLANKMGARTHLASWNQKLAPNRVARTLRAALPLKPAWNLEEGDYVTMCAFLNNTDHRRYNVEQQLNLVTDRDMETVRWGPVCVCP